MEVLASRLKWLREKHRYGQKEVASEIGITTSGYQKIEYNESNPKLEVLIKLAQFYKVSTDFLLGLSDDIEELEELKQEIIYNTQRRKFKQDDIQMLRQRVEESIRDIEYIKKKGNNIDKETRVQAEHHAVRYKELLVSTEYEIEKLRKEYAGLIIGFIDAIIDIPFTNHRKNHFLSRYLPIKVDVELNLFDEYSVRISGSDLYEVFGIYKYKEEAMNIKKRLDDLFGNGK